MWYIQAALLSEGLTDDRFLPALLTRAADELCRTEYETPVELADVIALRARKGPAAVSEIVELALENASAFNVYFFHHDSGSRDLKKVTTEWLEPLRSAWHDAGLSPSAVEVVPIRETEAWGLASGDALRSALGANFSNETLGVPRRAKDVEAIRDPKAVINSAVSQLSGPPIDIYSRLGDLVDLDKLRQVPSFLSMLEHLRSAFTSIGMRRI